MKINLISYAKLADVAQDLRVQGQRAGEEMETGGALFWAFPI